jgi:hypothetical protein
MLTYVTRPKQDQGNRIGSNKIWFPGIFCPFAGENIRGLHHYQFGTSVLTPSGEDPG